MEPPSSQVSAAQTFKPGDRVTFPSWVKVGGKYDHHSWNGTNHVGVIVEIVDGRALIKCDNGRERTAVLDRCKLEEPPC